MDSVLTTNGIDDGYRALNQDEIQQLFHFFDHDVNVKAAVQIMIQSLLSGGIWISHPFSDSNNKSQEQFDNIVWGRWSEDVLRSIWSIGFAPAMFKYDDATESIIPCVLSLETIEVRMKRTDEGECDFRYFKRTHLGKAEAVEIKNVMTFVARYPDYNYRINSLIATLLMDFTLEMHMLQCTLLAERSRAQPYFVTEQVEARYDPNSITVARLFDDPFVGDGSRSYRESQQQQQQQQNSTSTASLSIERIQQERRQNWLRYLNSAQAAIDQRLRIQGGGLASNVMNPASSINNTPQEIQLKPLQKLTRHVLPEAPLNLMTFRTERQVRVFMAFGVPMTMTRTHNQSNNRAQSNMGGAKDSASKDVFLNAQKSLKQLLLSYILRMYHFMYHNTHVLKLLKKYKNENIKIDSGKIKQEIQPKVTIASLPDEEVAEKLYAMGMLKYDAFVRLYLQKYGMDESDFNKTPQLPMLSIDQQQNEDKLTIEKDKVKQQLQQQKQQAKEKQAANKSTNNSTNKRKETAQVNIEISQKSPKKAKK